jgi:DNA-binding CsgD family transcriptional regulator
MGSVTSARNLRPSIGPPALVLGDREAPRRVDEALGRVLEAFPSAAYVVHGTTIHPANAVARERLAVDPTSLSGRLVYAAAHDRTPEGYAWISVEEGFVALEQERAVDTRWARKVARWELSRRQEEVLRGLLDGLSNAEIARSLGCKPRTVESHVAAIRERADARSRLELVAAYWAEG